MNTKGLHNFGKLEHPLSIFEASAKNAAKPYAWLTVLLRQECDAPDFAFTTIRQVVDGCPSPVNVSVGLGGLAFG